MPEFEREDNAVRDLLAEYGEDLFGWSDDGLRHSIGVARACYMLAKKHLGADEDKAREMFVLGLLHDFGYEFPSQDTGTLEFPAHTKVAATVLEKMSFPYYDEIAEHHSSPDCADDAESPELRVLRCADLIAGNRGQFCSYAERLKDLAERHGEEEVAKAEAIVDYLRSRGFDY